MTEQKIVCDGCQGPGDWYCGKCWQGAMRRQGTYEKQRDKARAEAERLRTVLGQIAKGFDNVLDAEARAVDGYYRGLAEAALKEGE